jgi:hypothetical protein
MTNVVSCNTAILSGGLTREGETAGLHSKLHYLDWPESTWTAYGVQSGHSPPRSALITPPSARTSETHARPSAPAPATPQR